MRYQGKTSDWKDDQGFGFIMPNGGGPRVFVHIKSFSTRQQRPAGNEIVTYELKRDAKGRPQAESVAFVGKRVAPASPSGRGNLLLILTAAFLVFVAGSGFAGRLPIAVTLIYLAASLIAFIAYALDKSAARNDQWRTKESTLHLLALAAGQALWPHSGCFATNPGSSHFRRCSGSQSYSIAAPSHGFSQRREPKRCVPCLVRAEQMQELKGQHRISTRQNSMAALKCTKWPDARRKRGQQRPAIE